MRISDCKKEQIIISKKYAAIDAYLIKKINRSSIRALCMQSNQERRISKRELESYFIDSESKEASAFFSHICKLELKAKKQRIEKRIAEERAAAKERAYN